ncbi:inositol monophosphatase family protein [Haloarchaeobius amylolyticus]|uniref:inositol monophosphatase family protein n=1 Tax=Haloarchaeobius amylolyticus TaxID=1198296 RepID=UPI00227028B7|nr:inositol monophosphatase [Haloarchaeobius amylolyticus]
MTEYADRVRVAEAAARAGAAVAAEGFRTGIAIEEKGQKTDVVTQADRDAQRAVIERIREAFPDDAIVGEEDDELKAVPASGPAWVIDPIDGTNNYVRDIPVWATSVAAVVDGEPVAAANVMPALSDCYTAGPDGARLNGSELSVSEADDPDRFVICPTIWWDFDRRDEYARACEVIVERFGDMRRFGCAQAVLGMVAAGSLEATITNVDPNPWDTVAGVYLVRQAGGTVTDLEGERWTHESQGLVASNGTRHDEVLAAARDVEKIRMS